MEKLRERRRSELYALLGELPSRERKIDSETIDVSERNGYLLERLHLDLNGIEPVPALFIRPSGPRERVPCILYNHAHGDEYHIGKDELLYGRTFLTETPYAEALSSAGFAALCIDMWCFGERRGRTEEDAFKEMLWKGRVLWGMMVYDSLRALDYLETREDVEPGRIGTMGISMGSTMAWWASALDTRIKVCVDLCCLTDFEALIETGGLRGHGIYYYVPSLMKHFTAAEINALIAPRPHLGLAGNCDPLTPPKGLDRIDAELRRVYRKAGAEDAWRLGRYNTGHFETARMRREVMEFLNTWL